MKAGEIVRMKSAKIIFGNERVRGTANMAAPKGKEMVFLLLGVRAEGEEFDADAALKSFGFVPEGGHE